MSEFRGKAGRIFIEQADTEVDSHRFEVWFEDFCILGMGNSELEALNNAWTHTGNIMALIAAARIQLINAAHATGGE